MTDPLSVLVSQVFTARLARSALPDAPVVARKRRAGLSIIGALVRRTTTPTDQEA